MIRQWIETHRYLCILMAVFVLGTAAFIYSYVQPRCTATVVSVKKIQHKSCLLYTSPSPRDATLSRMPSSA